MIQYVNDIIYKECAHFAHIRSPIVNNIGFTNIPYYKHKAIDIKRYINVHKCFYVKNLISIEQKKYADAYS